MKSSPVERACGAVISAKHAASRFEIEKQTKRLSPEEANRVAMYVANYGVTHSYGSMVAGALSFLGFRNEYVLIFANASACHCPHLTVRLVKEFCDNQEIARHEVELAAQNCLRRANTNRGMMRVWLEETIKCIECLERKIKTSKPSDAKRLVEHVLWQIEDGEKGKDLFPDDVRFLKHDLRLLVSGAEIWEEIEINASALSGCLPHNR